MSSNKEGVKYITVDDKKGVLEVVVNRYVTEGGYVEAGAKQDDSFVIKAGNPPSGQKFSKWQVYEGDASIKDKNNPETTVTVKSKDSIIKAIYCNDPTDNNGHPNTLLVTHGKLFRERVSGEGEDSDYQKVRDSYFEKSIFSGGLGAKKNAKFLIQPEEPPFNQEFSKWAIQRGDAKVEKDTESEAIVTMGSESSTIAAVFKATPSDVTTGGNKIKIYNGQLYKENSEAKKEIEALYKKINNLEMQLKDKLKGIDKNFKQVKEE